ncbi:glycosyltransferase domain-containing protein [Pectinatus frisingensis]|uniref:glycosyltransferase domain-containing protein n=1 Tax=Pectinatus frisingensis TaxID=865 RepID=UPI0018C64DDC|nr:glycosyltransferase domain-containing protein [Pectinatus frisingensis]
MNNHKRILLYGAGTNCIQFLKMVQAHPQIFSDEIVGIIDSSSEKIGRKRGSYIVNSPKTLYTTNWDNIVITSDQYANDIRRQLVDGNGIENKYIFDNRSYQSQKVIAYQYKYNINMHMRRKSCETESFNKDSLVVYTAIIGQYDILKNPLTIEPHVKYVCFTNQKYLQSNVWEIRQLNMKNISASLIVRQLKLKPHLFFPEYQTSIWIDASFQILSTMSTFMYRYQDSANILMFPHPLRYCIYDEAAACCFYYKEKKSKILRQIIDYFKEGYPIDNGLYCGGFLVRNHNRPEVIDTMNLWYENVERYSSRDQISLPFILWKTGIPIDLCDLTIWDNPWLKNYEHI